MQYQVIVGDAILFSTPSENSPKVVDPLEIGAVLDKISDQGLPEWINVRLMSPAAPLGFVQASKLQADTARPEIDPTIFFLKALDAALDPASRTNHQYLFALATAESKLRNVQSPIPTSDAFGPFQYTAARWAELVEKFGAAVGVNPGDRQNWLDQVATAAAEASHAVDELQTALGRAPVFDELCLHHVLANLNSADAMHVVSAAAAASEATLETVLQQSRWTEVDALLARLAIMQQPDLQPPAPAQIASVRRANVRSLLTQVLAPGFNTAAESGAKFDPPDPPHPVFDTDADPAQFHAVPGTDSIARRQQAAARVLSILRDKGWSPAQCCGIIANIDRESSFNERAVGDNGAAFGLCQWHSDRRKTFAQHFGRSMMSNPNFDEQVGFIDVELNSTEKRAGDRLRNQTTPGQAGFVVSFYYERPAGGRNTANARAGVAQAYANLLGI
jgi:hypothetical protein